MSTQNRFSWRNKTILCGYPLLTEAMHTIGSNDFVIRQQRTWSDYMDRKADHGLY